MSAEAWAGRQSEPLQLERLAELGTEVLWFPMAPSDLLREIESSLTLASSVTVDAVTNTVRWLLPSSKNDSTALSTTRNGSAYAKQTVNGVAHTMQRFVRGAF